MAADFDNKKFIYLIKVICMTSTPYEIIMKTVTAGNSFQPNSNFFSLLKLNPLISVCSLYFVFNRSRIFFFGIIQIQKFMPYSLVYKRFHQNRHFSTIYLYITQGKFVLNFISPIWQLRVDTNIVFKNCVPTLHLQMNVLI